MSLHVSAPSSVYAVGVGVRRGSLAPLSDCPPSRLLRRVARLQTEANGKAWRLESWGSRTDLHTASLSALSHGEIFHDYQLGALHNRFEGVAR